jgi:hypothetical protein
MKPESEKYNKVLNILRNSKPVLNSTADIEKKVIERISGMNQTNPDLSDVIDFMFGWVYIGWIRRSLITASLGLVLIFVYQQSVILKRINYLGTQTIVNEREKGFISADEFEKRLKMYKLSGRKFPSQNITISEKQMKQLLESVNELRTEYKDLLNLIEEDPELKKIIEKRMIENNRNKIKL